MTTFIWSITNTSAAVTLLCLASMPFITALLGFLFLKEVSIYKCLDFNNNCCCWNINGCRQHYDWVNLWIYIWDAFRNWICYFFSKFEMEKRYTTIYNSRYRRIVLLHIFYRWIIIQDQSFLSSGKNEALFATHGTIVCIGLILYSIGSKYIPAAELTLLSLTEVIEEYFGLPPILGINEVPTSNTIVGGFFIFISIIYYSLIIQNNKRFIGLN